MPKVKKKYGGIPPLLVAKAAKMASESKMVQELSGKAVDFVQQGANAVTNNSEGANAVMNSMNDIHGGPIVKLTDVKRSFTQGTTTIHVLRGIDLTIAPGEIVALLGPSGSGKSTLLQAVGLLEGGFEGSIMINGEEAAGLSSDGRTRLRKTTLGFVYQFHHLLPDFNASENVVLPQLVLGTERADAEARAEHLLTVLGLGERLEHRPSKLSGGEQQRVAVARALANQPLLVLADEPTGNLDEHTADIVLGEFLRLVREEGSSALVATHNERLAAKMDRVVRLHEGYLK